jgi:hypothetical protein
LAKVSIGLRRPSATIARSVEGQLAAVDLGGERRDEQEGAEEDAGEVAGHCAFSGWRADLAPLRFLRPSPITYQAIPKIRMPKAQ